MDQRAAVPRANRPAQERVVRQLSQPAGRLDLRSSELRAVLDFAERLLAITDAAAVPSMLDGLAQLVDADSSTLMRINLRTGQEEAVLWPAARADSAVLQYAAVSRTHPLRPSLAVQARSGVRRPAAIRISDVLTRRQWRASALHAASHRGIDDQMCVLLAARQHTIQLIVLSRHHDFFTHRQVALLDAARAHLAAAVQRIGPQRLPALQVAPTVRRVLAPVALPERLKSPPRSSRRGCRATDRSTAGDPGAGRQGADRRPDRASVGVVVGDRLQAPHPELSPAGRSEPGSRRPTDGLGGPGTANWVAALMVGRDRRSGTGPRQGAARTPSSAAIRSRRDAICNFR